MTSEYRALLKAAIDAERRRITAYRKRDGCGDCDGPYDEVTPGCKLCSARQRNRAYEARLRLEAAA